MINNTLNDETQKAILPVLRVTEELLTYAVMQENGGTGNAIIIAMPDLGLASNSMRMAGGFYTGCYIEWESKIPFIPVDSTVNSCGVSIYTLKNELTVDEFQNRLLDARRKTEKANYNWNFERGNHFISLCKNESGGNCVIMHASADEYKRTIAEKALYPSAGVWFYDDIKTYTHPAYEERYIRYITGRCAERFAGIASDLEAINHNRMNDFAEMIFGSNLSEEIVYAPHYGMPTESSIAIGCSWKPKKTVLLTVPGKTVYLLEPQSTEKKEMWLVPHGFGVSIQDASILYRKGGLYINEYGIESDEDVKKLDKKGIRFSIASDVDRENHVNQISECCNARIAERINPIATISSEGFAEYRQPHNLKGALL